MRKRNKNEGHDNKERWLLTYSDMITLLLALFIMLYTISTLDANKYSALSQQLGIFLGSGNSVTTSESGFDEAVALASAQPTPAPSESAVASEPAHQIFVENTQLQEELQSLIDNAGLDDYASVNVGSRGVVVQVVEGLLFNSGSASINDNANDILTKIIGVVNSVDNYIRIEGYTDDIPMRSAQFDSNWELASQRAINVAKMFIASGVDPSRLSATSYGEYRPVVPNDSVEHRQLNRRVDIVFISSNLSIYEAGGGE